VEELGAEEGAVAVDCGLALGFGRARMEKVRHSRKHMVRCGRLENREVWHCEGICEIDVFDVDLYTDDGRVLRFEI
jgi:hypothetical protein